ncbi:hypothetical protein DPMN_113844 [Dreissena polymorpha]|uniref:BZIP domain-containing protein n=2 Tax=Dreissena polymorpha TaxID=45954 RepID=A0A9D4KIU4_DREPO|nr:hypothetical protein DPMN_113844 [Dreissena polymorpha]
MAGPQTAILDLLFDQSDGVLVKENIPDLHSLDFSALGLTLDGFDDMFVEDLLGMPEKPSSPNITAFKDHDYVMQATKSPAGSDSGVSVDSDGLSHIFDLTTSCSSVSQMIPHVGSHYGEHSPCSASDTLSTSPEDMAMDALDLENFDFGDVNFDTIEPSDLIDDDQNVHVLDNNVSIDLESHSDLMTFSTKTNTAISPDGIHTKTIKIIKVSNNSDTLPFTMKDVSTGTKLSGSFPELRLTDEERDLLAKEGVDIPTDMPLTKEEERALKSVRRKIRNKVSAKESRKRKMDYVDGLEKRVKKCTQENQSLQKKVETLEKQNVTLINQLKKLQSLITIKSTRTAQASTCVMVLLLSFAFLIVPNFNPFRDGDSMEDTKTIPIPGKSRNLLHKSGSDLLSGDTDNPYGISSKPVAFWEQPQQSPVVQDFTEEIVEEMEVEGKSNVDKLGEVLGTQEQVVYVQIEKTVEESNVTYVTAEEYQTDHTYQTRSTKVEQTAGGTENGRGQKRKHDL